LGISIAGGKGSPPFKDDDEVGWLVLLVRHLLLLIDSIDLVFAFLSINPYVLMSIRTTSNVIQTMFQGVLCREWLRVELQLKPVFLLGTKSFLYVNLRSINYLFVLGSCMELLRYCSPYFALLIRSMRGQW
jgi:hypothetical protein